MAQVKTIDILIWVGFHLIAADLDYCLMRLRISFAPSQQLKSNSDEKIVPFWAIRLRPAKPSHAEAKGSDR